MASAPSVGCLRQHRRVVGEAALAGRERIRRARGRVEPHDAVVHGDAGLARDEFGAECREQGLRHRRHVAVAVDRGEMRGAGRRQCFRAERAPSVGVAHVFEALAIGRLQRRGIGDVGGCIGCATRRLQTFLQQAERARKRWPGGEFRRRKHLAAAIGNRQRLAQMGAEWRRDPRPTARRRRPEYPRQGSSPDRLRRSRAGLEMPDAPSSP